MRMSIWLLAGLWIVAILCWSWLLLPDRFWDWAACRIGIHASSEGPIEETPTGVVWWCPRCGRLVVRIQDWRQDRRSM